MSGPWQGSNGDQQGSYQGGYQGAPGYGGYQDPPASGYGHPGPSAPNQGAPGYGPEQGGFSQAGYQQSQFGQGGYPQNGYQPGGYQHGPYGRPPRNPNRTLIIVVLGVLLLAGAGVGSYFLFFKKDSAAAGGSSATAVADQLKAAIDRNDYAAVNDLTCTAEKVPAEQIQFTVDQIKDSGAILSVTIESVQEDADTAAVQYTIHSQNPQTNEKKEVQQTATLHKNSAGRWIACDGQLGPQDQG